MNNEEKILEILVQMQGDIANLKTGQAKMQGDIAGLKAGQTKLEADVSNLRSEINDRFDTVDRSIEEVLKDLDIVQDRIDLHDTKIKSIM